MGERIVIVIVESDRIGDSLMCIPAMLDLADRKSQMIFTLWRNAEVAKLCPSRPNIKSIWELPLGLDADKILTLGIRQAVDLHPTALVKRLAGFGDASEPAEPGFVHLLPVDVPTYDFVFAPMSADMEQRGLAPERHVHFLTALFDAFPGSSVALLGSRGDGFAYLPVLRALEGQHGFDERVMDETLGALIEGLHRTETGDRVTVELGLPLDAVGAILQQCRRAVITVDSSISRLCHAVGIRNHLLLGSTATPPKWCDWPWAETLYGQESWIPLNVVKVVRQIDAKLAAAV